GVRADVVAFDHGAGGAWVGDLDADAAVTRDDVARRRDRAADRGVAGAVVDQDAVTAVGQGLGPRGIGADVVARDHVIVRVRVAGLDARKVFAGDAVSASRGRAADGVGAGAAVDEDAFAGVGQGLRAGGVGTDVVAHDDVAGGGAAVDLDPEQGVPGEEVAGG